MSLDRNPRPTDVTTLLLIQSQTQERPAILLCILENPSCELTSYNTGIMGQREKDYGPYNDLKNIFDALRLLEPRPCPLSCLDVVLSLH